MAAAYFLSIFLAMKPRNIVPAICANIPVERNIVVLSKSSEPTGAGPTWATVSMFPYKYFKAMTTEGGIKSPCIIKLPKYFQKNGVIDAFTHVTDLLPTFLDLSSSDYTKEKDPRFKTLIGQSLTPLFKGDTLNSRPEGLGYEIFGNRAYFSGDWKIVSSIPPFGDGTWELYKISDDPFERTNLALERTEKLNELILKWNRYSTDVGIVYDPMQLNFK